LGFIHDGELFICSRLKDLIIVRGRNHYPQDIERSLEGNYSITTVGTSLIQQIGIRKGCSAAFGVTVGSVEHLIYAAEVADDVYGLYCSG